MLAHVAERGLSIAGLRLLWLTAAESQTLSCFSPYKPPTGTPTFVFAARGVSAVNAWVDTVGPDDPVLARRTDPQSLRALHGTDRNQNLLVCTRSSPRALRDVALFFGGRIKHDYKHSEAMPLVIPYRPSNCVIMVRPDLLASSYGKLLGSLAAWRLAVLECSRVEASQPLAIQLDLIGGKRGLLLMVGAENCGHRVRGWKASLEVGMAEHVELCFGEAEAEALKCLTTQLPGKQAVADFEGDDDDTDAEQTVVATIAATDSAAAAVILKQLLDAVPDAWLLSLKLIPSLPSWALKTVCESAVSNGDLLGQAANERDVLVVAVRGFGVRDAWGVLVNGMKPAGSAVMSESAQAAHMLLSSLFRPTEIDLPKSLVRGTFLTENHLCCDCRLQLKSCSCLLE